MTMQRQIPDNNLSLTCMYRDKLTPAIQLVATKSNK